MIDFLIFILKTNPIGKQITTIKVVWTNSEPKKLTKLKHLQFALFRPLANWHLPYIESCVRNLLNYLQWSAGKKIGKNML